VEFLGLRARSQLLALKGGWEGHAKSSEIRLGRGTSSLSYRSYIQIQPTSWLELILHTFSVGTSHGRPLIHLTHHGPNSGGATTFPHIVFSTALCCTCIQNGSFSWDSQSGIPKLSRFGFSGLWAFITSRPKLGSGRGPHQSCSLLESFPTVCRTSPARIGIRSIPNF